MFTLRAPQPAPAEAASVVTPALTDPFAIELDHPIPVPSEPIVDRSASRIEALPVAFPGYLLPGDGDDDDEAERGGPVPEAEERGHARP